METIVIASLGKPFGLKGEIHCYLNTDFPELRFKKGAKFLLCKDGASIPVTFKNLRAVGKGEIISFQEITSIEQAEALQYYEVRMEKEKAVLPEGYVRFADLIGCKAIDDGNNELGEIIDVVRYAPTPNLKIKRPKGNPFYVPFKEMFVGDIDLEKKTVVIHVMEGML